MVSICLLGGAEEIGGNKILLHGEEGAIFLDFGLNLKKKREYAVGYGFERINRVLRNYLLVGILPKINGVYREDLALDEKILNNARSFSIDCCIVSHGHLDHYGSIAFLRMETPIAVSKSMKILIEHSIETSGRTGIDREIFIYRDRRREELKKKIKIEENLEEVERPIIVFEEGRKISQVPFQVLPIPVDHSIPATFGFRIETNRASIAYTSDIRLHGVVSKYTEEFIEKVRDVDILLIEGTRINDSTTRSEDDVKNQVIIETLKKKNGKLVSTLVSPLDIDRVRTLIEAAEECNRIPILSSRIYHLIKTLYEEESKVKLPNLENVKVYFEKRSIIDEGYFLGSTYFRGWLKKIYESLLNTDKLIKPEEISKHQDRFFLIFNSHQCVFELAEINPTPGSLFIESTSEPHDEEQEIEWEKVENWINLLRLDSRWIHASGHANREDLLKIIKEIKPNLVIPLHTENPREFKRMLEKEDIKVEIIQEGEETKLS